MAFDAEKWISLWKRNYYRSTHDAYVRPHRHLSRVPPQSIYITFIFELFTRKKNTGATVTSISDFDGEREIKESESEERMEGREKLIKEPLPKRPEAS